MAQASVAVDETTGEELDEAQLINEVGIFFAPHQYRIRDQRLIQLRSTRSGKRSELIASQTGMDT
jgi:hypothetical protein